MSESGCEILRDPDNASVDIVFVHGIFGHRRLTWEKNGFFWPSRLLPDDVRDARIITFGYSTAAVQWAKSEAKYKNVMGIISLNGLKGNAELLSIELVSKRPDKISKRPIVFVAHSMGGLVVAQLVVLGNQSANNANVTSIAKQTKGICFLGTPFLGSSTAKWGKKIATFLRYWGVVDTRSKNIEDLKPESAALVELNEAFFTTLNKRRSVDSDENPIEIACFFEAHATKGLLIVDRDSAGPWGCVRTPIDADHDGICKFDSSDIGYQHVLLALKTLMASSPVQQQKVLPHLELIDTFIHRLQGSGSNFHNNNSTILNQAHSMSIDYGASTFNF